MRATSSTQIARAVSERRGGLPGVEAMALPHGTEEIEVACNLRDISRTSTSTLEKVYPGMGAAKCSCRAVEVGRGKQFASISVPFLTSYPCLAALQEIQRLSIAEGVSFGPGYVTGVDPDQALLSIQGLN